MENWKKQFLPKYPITRAYPFIRDLKVLSDRHISDLFKKP